VHVGLYFSHQLPRPWAPDAEERLFTEGLEQVHLADELGFDSAWVSEQHFLEEYSHSSAPEVFLAAASQVTQRIRLGHGIVLMPPAYNAPARVAERIATLDLVSHGRVEFGIGDSKSRVELEGFGIAAADRRRMSVEALEQTARMLAMTPYPGHQGEFFSMPARNVVPKPVQKPHPPLWMACSDDASIQAAARMGIGALAHGFFDVAEAEHVVAGYYETFKRECVPIGLTVNPQVAMLNPFHCHEAGDDRAEAAAHHAFGYLTFALRHYYTFGRHRPGQTDLAGRYAAVLAELGGAVPVRGGHAVGTPEQITERLLAHREVGVDQTILIHQAGDLAHEDICRSLELFARDVLPAVTRDRERRLAAKREQLAPYVEAAFARKASAAEPTGETTDEVIEAYGRDRPPLDLTMVPESRRATLRELDHVKEVALRLEAEEDLPSA
jgi:alkanesulfonate monooxygenase SsuD/methylene tetrahydromethanopterin reductase-like flavin-dependent oxidoreductase (luciferase family)